MTHSFALVSCSKTTLCSLFLLFFLTTGCTRPQGVFPNYQEDDLRERHPVKHQATLQKLSIIPIGSKRDQISHVDASRINGFIENYKLSGLDHLTITYSGSKAAEPTVTAILKSHGELESFTKLISSKAGPIEISLSYTATQIVPDRMCEGKNTDGGLTYMVPNKTIGCAYTSAFSQQIDQPSDLLEPRQRDKKYYKNNPSTTSTNTSPSISNSSTVVNSVDAIKALIN